MYINVSFKKEEFNLKWLFILTLVLKKIIKEEFKLKCLFILTLVLKKKIKEEFKLKCLFILTLVLRKIIKEEFKLKCLFILISILRRLRLGIFIYPHINFKKYKFNLGFVYIFKNYLLLSNLQK